MDKTGGEDNVDSLDSWSRWQSNETVQPILYCSWTKLLTQTLNFDVVSRDLFNFPVVSGFSLLN